MSDRQRDFIRPLGICVAGAYDPIALSNWLTGSKWLIVCSFCEGGHKSISVHVFAHVFYESRLSDSCAKHFDHKNPKEDWMRHLFYFFVYFI